MKNINEKINNLIGKKINTKNHRFGDNGSYGRALEEALGVEENNVSGPDINDGETTRELKTTDNKARITNFSKEPKWNVNKKFKKMQDFFDHYSYVSDDGIRRLNLTLYGDRYNSHNFILKFDQGKLFITHKTDGDMCCWEWKDLEKKFAQKLDSTSVVSHKAGVVTSHDEYNNICAKKVNSMLKSGKIVVETRLTKKQKNGKPYLKNRGTAFRVSPTQFSNMFAKKEE